MKRWIRRWIGTAAVLILVFQPEEVLASENPQQIQVEQTRPESAGWEEEYTDTDSRRGTLSVRCQVFQGFHGVIELYFQNAAGGWERSVTLTEEGGYAVNLSLPVGAYQIEEIKAQTDGRRYDCQAEQTEVTVDDGKIVMCRITVTPASVYRLPYADEAMTAAPSVLAVADDQAEAETMERIGDEAKQETERRIIVKIRPFWILGIMGFLLCLGSLYHMTRRRKNMGG